MKRTLAFLKRLYAEKHPAILYDYDAADLARELRDALAADLAELSAEAREAAFSACFDSMEAHAKTLHAALAAAIADLGTATEAKEVLP